MNSVYNKISEKINSDPAYQELYQNDPHFHGFITRLSQLQEEEAIEFVVNVLFQGHTKTYEFIQKLIKEKTPGINPYETKPE